MRIATEQYNALVAAYRERPGSALHASKAAKVSRKTAKKAWDVGWPEERPPKLAIQAVLELEAAETQAKAHQVRNETEAFAATLRSGARNEALETREQEARLIKAARVNVANLLVATGKLGPALQSLSSQVQKAIEAETLPPTQLAGLLRNLSAAAAQSVRAGQMVVQLERLHRGDPTQILGLGTTTEMTAEEAVAELEAAQDDLQRYRRRGLSLIDGGATTIDVTPKAESAS